VDPIADAGLEVSVGGAGIVMPRDSNTLRVKAFLPYPNGRVPGQRFRIEQWAPLLRAHDIDVVFTSFLSPATMEVLYESGHHWEKFRGTVGGYARTLRAALELEGFDVAYIYREAALLGRSWIERLIAARIPVVFDFDDAIYLGDVSRANSAFAWLKSGRKTHGLCQMSTAVVVGNVHLAEFARRYNANVTVVPSSIDTARYRRKDVRVNGKGRPLVIGWMGSSTTQRFLEEFEPVLRRIADRFPIEIRVVSDHPPSLEGLPVTWHRWSDGTEAVELADFDIGIMPLPDTPWTRGKCAMKALQYMGVAVPTVCSPVGVNSALIRHGENGLLAATTEDWVDAVGKLVADPHLRASIGEAGRRTVEGEYSATVCASLFARALREAAAVRRN
jgi:glycosyltransferase involved in cell wall biosynthesis